MVFTPRFRSPAAPNGCAGDRRHICVFTRRDSTRGVLLCSIRSVALAQSNSAEGPLPYHDHEAHVRLSSEMVRPPVRGGGREPAADIAPPNNKN